MTFLIVGTAPSLNEFDLSALQDETRLTTISCNGILRTGFNPDHLIISDRRPYIPELESGRLEEYAEHGNLLLSNTIWDRRIRCAGTPVQDKPSFPFTEWRVGACSTAINWTSFKTPLCSFATTAGQMLQAAVILGATKIGIIGIDLVAPKEGTMHCYEDGGSRKGATIQKDGKTMGPEVSYKLFRQAKTQLHSKGITVANLSPTQETAFASIFGTEDHEKFMGCL